MPWDGRARRASHWGRRGGVASRAPGSAQGRGLPRRVAAPHVCEPGLRRIPLCAPEPRHHRGQPMRGRALLRLLPEALANAANARLRTERRTRPLALRSPSRGKCAASRGGRPGSAATALAGPAPTTLPRPRVPRERPRHTRTRAHTHQPHGRASRRAAGTRRTRASRSSGGQPRPQLPLRESLEPHSSPEPRRRPARPPSRESGPPRPSACWLLGCSLPGALPRALPPASCIPPSRRCAVDGGPRAGSALSPGSAELLSPATRATSPPAPRPDGT